MTFYSKHSIHSFRFSPLMVNQQSEILYTHTHIYNVGVPGSSAGKDSACNVGDLGLIPGLRRSPAGYGNPLKYSCLVNSTVRGACRAGYSPRGHRELDTTEQLSTVQHTYICVCISIYLYISIYMHACIFIYKYVYI